MTALDHQSGRHPRPSAAFIRDMLMELRVMSQSINQPMLAYLIEMAMIEASDLADGRATTPQPASRVSAEELARRYMTGELD